MSFDKLANIAVIVAASSVAGFNVYDRVRPRDSGALAAAKALLGKPIDLPVSKPPKNRASVALSVSKTCAYCIKSADFYRRLSSALSALPCRPELVALAPKGTETIEELETFAKSLGLVIEGTGVAEFSKFGIPGTPTLLVVDRNRIVRDVRVGFLQEQEQDEVIAKTRSICEV